MWNILHYVDYSTHNSENSVEYSTFCEIVHIGYQKTCRIFHYKVYCADYSTKCGIFHTHYISILKTINLITVQNIVPLSKMGSFLYHCLAMLPFHLFYFLSIFPLRHLPIPFLIHFSPSIHQTFSPFHSHIN